MNESYSFFSLLGGPQIIYLIVLTNDWRLWWLNNMKSRQTAYSIYNYFTNFITFPLVVQNGWYSNGTKDSNLSLQEQPTKVILISKDCYSCHGSFAVGNNYYK